jgi:hypothetical protein
VREINTSYYGKILHFYKRRMIIMMNQKHTRQIAGYWKETYKNKLCAIVLLIGGMLPILIDGDGTALLFFGCIAVPMFFAKKNWMLF